VKKFFAASLALAMIQTLPAVADKILYDADMGPETELCDPLLPKPIEPDYRERDQNFDEKPPEADWPSEHDDPYPQELILEIHN
jgi:hypothetical protein